MARKKQVESSGGNAPWLNTFADLMNLLLCFFVMLFAMSDVNGEKFKDISISLTNSFGVFDGGGSAIGDGQLISSGATQLNDLGEYFSDMGEKSEKSSSQNIEKQNGTSEDNSSEDYNNKNNDQTQSTNDSKSLSEAMKEIQKHKIEASSKMYNNVSDLTDKFNLGDSINLSIDPDFQFVQLTLKGSVLFDSGDATIKDVAKPILSRIGEILKRYDGYTIEIEGHTDNVPMNSKEFKDNNWLSSARALNAAEFLIKTKHMDPKKIKYSGRGEYEAIASNKTAAGRAKNRRIEIKIYNKYSGR